EADRPIVDYIMIQGAERIGVAFDGVLDNLPSRWAAWLVRFAAFPFGIAHRTPSDECANAVAEILLSPSTQRDRLTPGLHCGEGRDDHALAHLEEAFLLVVGADPIEKKMRDAKVRDAGKAL